MLFKTDHQKRLLLNTHAKAFHNLPDKVFLRKGLDKIIFRPLVDGFHDLILIIFGGHYRNRNGIEKLVALRNSITDAGGTLKKGKSEVRLSEIRILASGTPGGEFKGRRKFK